MVATLINTITIIIGGLLGSLFKKKIKKEISEEVLKIIGLVIIIIGLVGALKMMITINQDGNIESNNELLLLISLAVGAFIGSILKIDTRLTNIENKIENHFQKNNFTTALINASLIFCTGAMAIVGSIEVSIGNNNMIFLKSAIDGVTALVLASTLGIGVIFSSGIVFIYQGLIVLISSLFITNLVGVDQSILTQNEIIRAISLIGNVIVSCIGINFLFSDNSSFKIKIVNLLPSLLIAILYVLIKRLF